MGENVCVEFRHALDSVDPFWGIFTGRGERVNVNVRVSFFSTWAPCITQQCTPPPPLGSQRASGWGRDKKIKKRKQISTCEKAVIHTHKTPTEMWRDFVVMRADEGVGVLSTWSRDPCSGIPTYCLLHPTAPPLAWIIQSIWCCCESFRNLPLRWVAKSTPYSLEFTRRSCLKDVLCQPCDGLASSHFPGWTPPLDQCQLGSAAKALRPSENKQYRLWMGGFYTALVCWRNFSKRWHRLGDSVWRLSSWLLGAVLMTGRLIRRTAMALMNAGWTEWMDASGVVMHHW